MKRKSIRALLLDLDGTVYFKGAQIPGAADALGAIKQMGLHLRFLTNTDSKTTESMAAELANMGLPIEGKEIFSAAAAGLEFMVQNRDKRCLPLVSKELMPVFEPFTLGEGQADYVIVGDCRDSVNYARLNEAFQQLMAGAELVALQKGRYYIRANGYNLDTGAFVTLLEYASGKVARVLGKPSPDFFRLALHQLGCASDEVAVVGDDVEADIGGGKGIGATAVLVRTGKFTVESLASSSAQPDYVVNSIADVPSLLRTIL